MVECKSASYDPKAIILNSYSDRLITNSEFAFAFFEFENCLKENNIDKDSMISDDFDKEYKEAISKISKTK